ncbi:MAG: hypothetical protein U0V75_08805 [Ferruginibacter sp.]
MSLDNIHLPAIVLQDLYKNSLVDLNNNQHESMESTDSGALPFLGNNQKSICIAVNDKDALYLSDELLNFLLGILSACKLSMADVALINAAKNNFSYRDVQEQFHAVTVLLFGIQPGQLQLPMQFPYYQLQKFNNQVYLAAPDLQNLQQDKAEKTKLWNSLKQVFNLG